MCNRFDIGGSWLGQNFQGPRGGGPRFFAAAITIEMAVIFFTQYLPNGFSWLNKGYEFVLQWGLVSLAIWLRGGGPYSVDRRLGVEL